MAELEARGIPGVYVASTEFVEAGAAQARALGFEPAAVFVPHPIQDRTDAEIGALADGALEEIVTALTVPRHGQDSEVLAPRGGDSGSRR